MANLGWISLHRSMLEWEWYGDINVCRLFTHLLLKANHKDSKWRGVEIKKGSLVTGRIALSEQTGLSERQVRTALNKLKSTSELTIKSTSKYSIISITNWNKHQGIDQHIDQQATSKRPASDQQATTNNNENNVNNEHKEKTPRAKKFISPSIYELNNFANDEKINITGFFDYYESNGWKVGKNQMKNWKAAARGWSKRQIEFNNQGKNNATNNTRKPKSAAESVRAATEGQYKHEEKTVSGVYDSNGNDRFMD